MIDQVQWPAVPGPRAVFVSTCKQSGRVCIYMQTGPAGPGQVDQVLAQLAQVDQAHLALGRVPGAPGHGPWPVLPGRCCTAATRWCSIQAWRGPWALCIAASLRYLERYSLVGTALAWAPAPGFRPPSRASQALARFHTMDDDRKVNWKKEAPFGYNRVSKIFFCKFLNQLANDP